MHRPLELRIVGDHQTSVVDCLLPAHALNHALLKLEHTFSFVMCFDVLRASLYTVPGLSRVKAASVHSMPVLLTTSSKTSQYKSARPSGCSSQLRGAFLGYSNLIGTQQMSIGSGRVSQTNSASLHLDVVFALAFWFDLGSRQTRISKCIQILGKSAATCLPIVRWLV